MRIMTSWSFVLVSASNTNYHPSTHHHHHHHHHQIQSIYERFSPKWRFTKAKKIKQPSVNPRPRAYKKHLGKQQRHFVPHWALLATSGCPVLSPTGSFANRPACFMSGYGEWSWRCEDDPISTCCQDGIRKWLAVLLCDLIKLL